MRGPGKQRGVSESRLRVYALLRRATVSPSTPAITSMPVAGKPKRENRFARFSSACHVGSAGALGTKPRSEKCSGCGL